MKPFRLVALVMLMFGLSLSAPAEASDLTVGQFVQQLAASKQLDSDNPQVAAASLSTRGTALPATLNLSKRLTEGDVVEIARTMGLNLTSSQPQNAFGRIQVDRFLSAFAIELGVSDSLLRNDEDDQGEDDQGENEEGIEDGGGPAFDPFSKAKGKGKQVTTETAP